MKINIQLLNRLISVKIYIILILILFGRVNNVYSQACATPWSLNNGTAAWSSVGSYDVGSTCSEGGFNYTCNSASACDTYSPSSGFGTWYAATACSACTVPSLNATDAATSILATSAQSGGNVTSAGSASVTERGICWGTSSNPTTSNNKITTTGTIGPFSGLSMTGLTPGTKYYVRSYAIGCGTAYGTETWFYTGVAPVITTSYSPIKIFCESATFGFLSGAIGNDKRSCCGTDALGDGLSQVSEFGFIYGVSNTDVSNSTVSSLAGASIKDVSIKNTAVTLANGIYNYQEVTGLTASTTYYVKGYSTNSQGTTYTSVNSFTTSSACAIFYSCSATNTWDNDNTCATPSDVPTSTSICYMRHDWGPTGGLTDANVQCGTATFMTARPYRLVVQSGGRVYMTGGNFTAGMQLTLSSSNAQFCHDGALTFTNSSTTSASNEISRLSNSGSIVVKGSYTNSLRIPSGGEYCYNGSWTNQTGGPGSINSDYSVSPTFPNSKYTNATCYGAVSLALPVKLTNFNIFKKDNKVLVSWSTSEEIDNAYFEIERSHDGFSFETIHKIEGKINSSFITKYSYFDEEVNVLLPIYYRLKQVDIDGKFDYSPLIVVSLNDIDKGIAVYPNPIEEDEGIVLHIKFRTVESGENAFVSLLDATGKEIQNYTIENIQTGGIYAVKDGDFKLPRGVYFIKVKTLNQIYNSKLIVK
jgi:hypothetical protein